MHLKIPTVVPGFLTMPWEGGRCWKCLYRGRDVIGISEPGSGKTLAYLLPIVARLHDSGVENLSGLQLLVVLPTRLVLTSHPIIPSYSFLTGCCLLICHNVMRNRIHFVCKGQRCLGRLELLLSVHRRRFNEVLQHILRVRRHYEGVHGDRETATQVASVSRSLKPFFGIRTACVFGGGDRAAQLEALQKQPHVLVATPGRLLDFLNSSEYSLGNYPSSLMCKPATMPRPGTVCVWKATVGDVFIALVVLVGPVARPCLEWASTCNGHSEYSG